MQTPVPPATPPSTPPDVSPAPAPGAPPAARRRIGRRASLLGAVLALLALAALGWLAWHLTRGGGGSAAPAAGPGAGPGGFGRGGPATTVGVAAAERADIPVLLDALGTVVPQATVRVRPQVSGVLQAVHFKEGQMVRRGDLLATIDPRPFEMALQQAIAQRMRDEAQLEAARVTLERFRTLLQQDSIARQEVDTQAATVRQLEAAVVADQAAEGTARLNLAYTRIASPIAGRVGLRTVDPGNVVSSGDANGVAVVTQLMPIDVEFAIPQDHAGWLQHNAGAFMEVKALDRTRTQMLDTGTFASLDNQIDTQTGTVRAKARFNNARLQLFPSQFVNVQLRLRTIEGAVVVPVSAVRQGGQGDYVFVVRPDRTVQMRPVVRGQALGDRLQIASGLELGERVVTEGADRLRDGARVVLPGDAPGAAAGGASGRRRRGGASAPGQAGDAAGGPARPFSAPGAAQGQGQARAPSFAASASAARPESPPAPGSAAR